MVELNVIIEIYNEVGLVIVMGMIDGVGVFIIIFLMGIVIVNEVLIVIVKDVVGKESNLIVFKIFVDLDVLVVIFIVDKIIGSMIKGY